MCKLVIRRATSHLLSTSDGLFLADRRCGGFAGKALARFACRSASIATLACVDGRPALGLAGSSALLSCALVIASVTSLAVSSEAARSSRRVVRRVVRPCDRLVLHDVARLGLLFVRHVLVHARQPSSEERRVPHHCVAVSRCRDLRPVDVSHLVRRWLPKALRPC